MRAKMDRANRAKQFMPFAALTGLDVAMQTKEQLREEEISLGEDAQLALDLRLRSLPIGAEVCAVFYYDGRYTEHRGIFKGQDETNGQLLVGRERIDAARLLDIEAI